MTRVIFAAVATVSALVFGLQPARTYEAPWCAMIQNGTGSVYWDCQYRSSKSATAKAIFWVAIAASAIPARTTSLDPRSKARPGNVALARSSGATGRVVNVRYWPLADRT